jgi:CNT family concentrative nucleoside transporter
VVVGMPQLISLVGAAVMVGLAFSVSTNRKAVDRRVLIWGLGMQWAMAFLLLWLPQGQIALGAAAGAVQGVLDHSFEGSAFLFGDLGRPNGGDSGLGVVFAFQVLPTIVFVASLFAVLYHLGVMQVVVGLLAKVMIRTMGTSGAESLSVAASVFMGQTEAPLTIRPFLSRLTESELFAVMVSGMASVSGAILGAYVLIGKVDMADLLTAVAMTAPVSLMMAKIIVPETGQPETGGEAPADAGPAANNVLDAAARGASDGLKLAVNVGAMLVAFIALISLINAALSWAVVGGETLTLQRVLGWLFAPIALLMGVPWSEAPAVGSILGTRTILNELVAFSEMRDLVLSVRSQSIATFAICGFAGISSIGIQIGGLGALVPERKDDIARLGVRALIAATLANFSTACVAGALL